MRPLIAWAVVSGGVFCIVLFGMAPPRLNNRRSFRMKYRSESFMALLSSKT